MALDQYSGAVTVKNSKFTSNNLKMLKSDIYENSQITPQYNGYEIFPTLVTYEQPFFNIDQALGSVEFIGNTFDSNSGFGGSFITITSQAQASVIIFKGNKFIQNSGLFNTALVDITDSKTCGGIVLDSNEFK